MAYKNNSFKSSLSFDSKIFTLYKYQIAMHEKLLKRIKLALPEHLSEHALYCVLNNKKLSLYTDSAIWSSQLRFYHSVILQSLLNSHTGIIETLQIKLIPPTTDQQPKYKRQKKIPSSKNINFILDQAEHQSDETLRNALLRLGDFLQSKSSKEI